MYPYRASRLCLSLVAGVALGLAMSAFAGDDVPTPAAKIDSGLGELPRYSQRQVELRYATPAEKIDSGLGALPPYAEWREPWLNSHPAERAEDRVDEMAPSGTRATARAAPPR